MEQKQFFDEQILDMMKGNANPPEDDWHRAGEVFEENQIHKGIKILGKWIYFERRDLTNVGITMLMPENFTEMASEAAMKKYPSQHRPEDRFLRMKQGLSICCFSIWRARLAMRRSSIFAIRFRA